jgi:hypothetical protein
MKSNILTNIIQITGPFKGNLFLLKHQKNCCMPLEGLECLTRGLKLILLFTVELEASLINLIAIHVHAREWKIILYLKILKRSKASRFRCLEHPVINYKHVVVMSHFREEAD